MNGTAVDVYLPCDVVAIRVRVAPRARLSPLEQYVLEAVHRGVRGPSELAELFGIGRRVMLHLLYDVWSRGYVLVDIGKGAVLLSGDAERHAAMGTLDQLGSGQVVEETRSVMIDRLSGYVLEAGGARRPADRRFAVPLEETDVTVDDVDPLELRAALRRIVESESGTGNVRFEAAYLAVPELRVAEERRWLPVTVRAAVDPDTDRLTVQVVQADGMPRRFRDAIGDRLTGIAEDRPDLDVVRKLRASASELDEAGPGVDELLARMRQQVERIDLLDDPSWGLRQHELRDLEVQVLDWLEVRQATKVEGEFVVGARAHHELLCDMIDRAEHQLLLAAPWVEYDRFSDLYARLEHALDRGVQIFLLWGSRAEDELDPRVRRSLGGLRRTFPTRFAFSLRSSITSSRLAVQDGARVLLTSVNLLAAAPSPATLQVGLVIRPADPNRPCRPIEQLLHWGRDVYPEYRTGRALYRSFGDFRLGQEPQQRRDWGGPGLPAIPLPPTPGRNDALAGASARAWRAAWAERVEQLAALAADPTPTARVLRDGQHQDALWSALRKATSRLVVASERAGAEVIRPRFMDMLGARLAAGAEVTLVYGRLIGRLAEVNLETMVQPLLDRFPERFRAEQVPSHARLLVQDDVAVVGTFDFLSQQAAGTDPLRRQTSDVGVELRGGDAVADLGELVSTVATGVPLAEAWAAIQHKAGPGTRQDAEQKYPPKAAREEPGDVQRATVLVRAEPVPRSRAARLLARISDWDTPNAFLTAFRQDVTEEGDPWELLEEFRAVDLPDSLLRLAVAATLADSGNARDPAADHWRRWLLQHAWRSGDFLEALLLRALIADSAGPGLRPRLHLAELAAALGGPGAAGALKASNDREDLTASEAIALVFAALSELLLAGSRQADEVLDELLVLREDDLDNTDLCEVVRAARAYWATTGRALPVDQIEAQLADEAQRRVRAAAWARLQSDFDKASQTGFRFDVGRKTHGRLFHPSGLFGRLQTLLDAKDAQGVAAWLEEPRLSDLGRLLDETAAETAQGQGLIEEPKRTSYLARLEATVEAAKAVAETAEGAEGAVAAGFDLAEASALAGTLAACWPALEQVVAAVEPPERWLATAALARLEAVRAWGSRPG